jgi:hypothetical protein
LRALLVVVILLNEVFCCCVWLVPVIRRQTLSNLLWCTCKLETDEMMIQDGSAVECTLLVVLVVVRVNSISEQDS